MKKLLLLVLLAPLFFASCSDDASEPVPQGYGALSLLPSVDPTINASNSTRGETQPLTDLSGYTLTLGGQESKVIDPIPAGGTIGELVPGNYSAVLGNYPTPYSPAFSDPRYSGKVENIKIESGKTATAAFTLTQANAGLRFIYDGSLETHGLGNIVPQLAQGGVTLEYKADKREATGYFAPGTVTLRIMNGDAPVKINRESDSRDYTVAAKDLLTITLKIDTNEGSMAVVAEIDLEVNNRTDEVMLEKPSGPIESTAITVAGMGGQTLTVSFTDDTMATVTLDASGKGSFEGPEGGVIKSIRKGSGDEIPIGRKVGENVEFATDGNALILRPAVTHDGSSFRPVGIVGELMLANSNLSEKFLQEADLDLMDATWTPLGAKTAPFTGIYDGGGKSISNINIPLGTPYSGLFAANSGTLRNIVMASGTVVGQYVGSICGYNKGTIDRCVNEGVTVSLYGATARAGGIAGHNHNMNAKITNCHNKGLVTGIGTEVSAGGICGLSEDDCFITACRNDGKIDVEGGSSQIVMAAGICGDNWWVNGAAASRITACYNTGKVSAKEGYAAGVVGYNWWGEVVACYNTGEIVGEGKFAGGICVQNDSGSIYRSFWSGYHGKAIAQGTDSGYFYFDDGTAAPEEVGTAWPGDFTSYPDWALKADGGYWKSHGEKGAQSYPLLWWE